MKRGTNNVAWNRVTRSLALSDQDSRCAYCKTRLTETNATADHVVPKARKGSNRRENIAAACKPCNRAKGDMSKGQFQKAVKHGKGGFAIQLAWMRRSINVATDRAVRNIERACR